MRIHTLVGVAEEEQESSEAKIRARGDMQFPILRKVEEILREELHHRIGYGEMAEVAITAMEEHAIGLHIGRRADELAAERETLGTTIAEIEAQELAEMVAFEEAHPEVMAGCVYDREMLCMARAQIDRELAKQDNERSDNTISERLRVARENRAAMDALGAERDWTPSQPNILQSQEEIAAGEGGILWAMKNAAWHSLQRLGTTVLIEYLELWRKKHHDYGPENHAIWGAQGCVIRLTDKLMRLKGHYFDGRMMLTDKVEDDWLDLIGYGLIGLIVERGQWPVATLEHVIEAMKEECEHGHD